MKKLVVAGFLIISTLVSAQTGKVYLFSYFTGNGEDGLHLAYSRDGLTFTALNNGKSFLTPSVGISKLMRDPCIIRTPDGTFHMVWTAGWTERGIGYSSSKDLVNWTEQKYIKVMEKEPSARNCWAPEISYDRKNNQFLIIWSTTIPGCFPDTEKAGDTWFVYFDKYMDKKMGAVKSKDLKSWEDISDKISFPVGVKHGTILEVDEQIFQNLLNNGKIR
jgi:hypothetical protein